ncbi:MAG: NUDIX hydrolase [Anaerolineae bacterium]|uniref:NUDIX hydrolase n=1 Tax=Promineifilum sp. TaxID=2664178 RepID=UPI001DFFDF57|nr:NUDIX hydrolase [Anaerolineales bacterium]MCB8936133.1 NUDIX hydrolase [Promineifilum sp.]MCO5182015.1 NUDIX domain-containing protein [Promineifilum sp.]MCW5846152.1 NUDIX hydrolase [Anaerolineae bacterium]
MPEPVPGESAPAWFAFCPRCGSPMVTERVADKPRRVCPACRYVFFTDPKVGVGVAVVDDGKLLLVRRAMNPERGKWSLPAGFVDQGSDPRVTAAREAWEETGLAVEIESVIDVFFNPPGAGGASIFILYGATLLGGQLQAGDDADDAGFFAPDQLPELAFASTRAAVAALFDQ